MKYHYLLGFLSVVAAYPGVIHEEAPQLEEKFDHHALIGESAHHHQVHHEHAKSHQSIKFEHFHPVPVYVKKEHSHLLKHPLEKGKSGQELKLVHPETEHKHGGGLVLEDHRFDTEHILHGHHEGLGFEHAGLEHAGLEHAGLGHAGLEHAEEQGALHYGGLEASEGLKAYAEAGAESGHYFHPSLSSDSGEGYKYENY